MEFDDITLGEIEEIEEYAKLPIQLISDMDTIGTHKLRVAFAWIVKRRVDPNFSITDARKMTTKELFALMGDMLHEMQRRDAKKGLAALCIGGGMGVALTVER
jgi:hypothetical protein